MQSWQHSSELSGQVSLSLCVCASWLTDRTVTRKLLTHCVHYRAPHWTLCLCSRPKVAEAFVSVSKDLREASVCRSMAFRSSACYMLVIEKEAVFQALIDSQLTRSLPCVLVTAAGMPDVATRAFITCILAACPQMQCLGLVDYNPSGIHILLNYKLGGQKSSREAVRY